ncbi:hypothetical protein IGI04_026314 [Brassica rapa subsp. trilocularis]|uniref:Reverse transcriptase zinc-binding domain-containing protein n=1 Tax=Brassica rapa subsp. trilocularis TaxID=1813537 RepID=A0ABQ7KVN1_BRACM|nr:hypothetical protein IGI04_026314 [Brassica rapa subsp. trilocularis]
MGIQPSSGGILEHHLAVSILTLDRMVRLGLESHCLQQWQKLEMLVSGSVHKSFVSKAVWNEIRPVKQVVSWASLVWHKAIVPRHTTNAWLFVLNRNPTLDRIHNWDAESLTTCLLCGLENESHDHLFFECQYSLQVWLRIINRLSLPTPPSAWTAILLWLPHAHGDGFRRLALLQGWQAAIYILWQERNARMHSSLTLSLLAVARRALDILLDNCHALCSLGSSRGPPQLQIWQPPQQNVPSIFSI